MPLPAMPSMKMPSEMRDHLLSQPPSFKKKKEYTLQKELGRGGFGKVIQAKWKPPNGEQQQVALKVISKKRLAESDADIDIADEIDNLMAIDHPHVVRLLDHFESRDNHYLAFQLATGGELFDRIETGGKFTERNAAECLRQILEAVDCLHSHNIVHRDIKPQNILYINSDKDSPIVVADMGVSKVLKNPEELITGAAGSLTHCPPEVLRDEPFGLKVDCWAVGVIAYTLLCGYEPFRGDDEKQVAWKIQNGKAGYEHTFWRKISPEAKDFCQKLINKDQKARWSARQALEHPWLRGNTNSSGDYDLAANIRKNQARTNWNRAYNVITASNRLRTASGSTTTTPVESTNPSPTSIPRTLSPLSVDVETDDEDGNYFTASERESIGPATPSRHNRSTSTLSGPSGDVPVVGSGAALKVSMDGRPGVDDIVEDKIAESLSAGDSPTKKGAGTGYGGSTMFGLKGMMGKLGL